MILTACRSGPIAGLAAIPGDKSCSHRALILGAMTQGETAIRNLLACADTDATAEAMRALGATVEATGDGIRVRGGPWTSPMGEIDCGNSGTLARLLIGAIAGRPGVEVRLTGDPSLSRRPMRRLVAPLRRMGANITDTAHLPLRVRGTRLAAIAHRNDPPSAQVKSALLLAGLDSPGPVEIEEPWPSRDHGERMLRQFGVDVEATVGRVHLGASRRLCPADIVIGADPSSAAFPMVAAAMIAGSQVRFEGLLVNPHRTGLMRTLAGMGAGVRLDGQRQQSGEPVAEVTVRHDRLAPCRVSADQIPSMIDEIPALAMACALAEGESVIEGVGELRHKESDRLCAIVDGLTTCGVSARAQDDRLTIQGTGRVRGGTRVRTSGDHRIAMAFLTLGLVAEQPIEVDEAQMIGTSFPGFAETMAAVGARIG